MEESCRDQGYLTLSIGHYFTQKNSWLCLAHGRKDIGTHTFSTERRNTALEQWKTHKTRLERKSLNSCGSLPFLHSELQPT